MLGNDWLNPQENRVCLESEGRCVVRQSLVFAVCSVLTFVVASTMLAASDPYPADGATLSGLWVTLSWSPGAGAVSHDVYLGTDYAHVRNGTGGTFRSSQTWTTFRVGQNGSAYVDGLVMGTTYYWRIDDVDGAGRKFAGAVWSFTILGTSEKYAVYVSAQFGQDQNVGSSSHPVKTLERGLQMARGYGREVDVRVHQGEYTPSDTLVIEDNISLVGGFSARATAQGVEDWRREILLPSQDVDASKTQVFGASTAISVFDVRAKAVISGLTIVSAPGSDGSPTRGYAENSIGIYVRNCNGNLIIVNNTIVAGRGGDGADGAPGASGNAGAKGKDGSAAVGSGSVAGGAGGLGGLDLRTGARCSNGGQGGKATYDHGFNGSPPSTGGAGGDAWPDAGGNGKDGLSGSNGRGGVGGDGGEIVAHKWRGMRGTDGGDGGCGGGGGGGGAGYGSLWPHSLFTTGGSGGGGGGGGSGGTGGGGGYAGGASIGIFMSEAWPQILRNRVTTVAGGRGGDGGSPGCGGLGGTGGDGGPCSTSHGECVTGQGGKGGDGGAGGSGGGGAGGAGGASHGWLAVEAMEDFKPYYENNTCNEGPAGEGGGGGSWETSGIPSRCAANPGSPGEPGPGGSEDHDGDTWRPVIRDGGDDHFVFPVPVGAGDCTISASWRQGDISVMLVSPSGSVYDGAVTIASVFHLKGPTCEIFRITNPEPGQWMVRVSGRSIPGGAEQVTLDVYTASSYQVVDDFESYTDEDEGLKRIYETWIDGFGYAFPPPGKPGNGTGSAVGNESAPFAEQGIVHGGAQSMPLAYDNTVAPGYSNADRTFAPPQDWTLGGVTTLVIHFYGSKGNTGQLYAKVNGSKVRYSGNPSDIAATRWTAWEINLATFGVNLGSVTALTIGVEGGGTGTVYIDDIYLKAQ
jgi:hypothetical protein